MKIVNMHEAKTHFSKLVDSVIHGNEVIIAIAEPLIFLTVDEQLKNYSRLVEVMSA